MAKEATMNTMIITTLSISERHIADLPDTYCDDHDVVTAEVIALCDLLRKPSGYTPSGKVIYTTRLSQRQVELLLPVIQSEIIDKYDDLADCCDDTDGRREYRTAVRYWRKKQSELSAALAVRS
jgi:hypothetical protein